MTNTATVDRETGSEDEAADLTWAEEWEATIAEADPLAADGITIHQRIIWLQGLIAGVGKQGFQKKDQYSFRRIDDVMNTVHVPLCKAGLYIKPIEVEVRVEAWEAWKNFNREFWVKMNYEITDAAGAVVSIEATGNAINAGDKGIAAAKSYAYKQMMGQLLSLPTEDPSTDVEHTNHDTTEPMWWERLGWASQSAAESTRSDLMARTRDLPEMEAGEWKKWAGVQETPADGMLYSKANKRFASQVSPDMASSWRTKLDELESLAKNRLEERAEPWDMDSADPVTGDQQTALPLADSAAESDDADEPGQSDAAGATDEQEETPAQKADRIAAEIAAEEEART